MDHVRLRCALGLVMIALVCIGCNALKRTAYEGFDRDEVILAEYDDPLLPEWSVRNKKTPAPFLTSSDPPFLFPSLGLETYA